MNRNTTIKLWHFQLIVIIRSPLVFGFCNLVTISLGTKSEALSHLTDRVRGQVKSLFRKTISSWWVNVKFGCPLPLSENSISSTLNKNSIVFHFSIFESFLQLSTLSWSLILFLSSLLRIIQADIFIQNLVSSFCSRFSAFLDKSIERIAISVAWDNDEDFAEPDELWLVQGQCLVGIVEIVAESVPLSDPNQKDVNEADVFADKCDCTKSQ